MWKNDLSFNFKHNSSIDSLVWIVISTTFSPHFARVLPLAIFHDVVFPQGERETRDKEEKEITFFRFNGVNGEDREKEEEKGSSLEKFLERERKGLWPSEDRYSDPARPLPPFLPPPK